MWPDRWVLYVRGLPLWLRQLFGRGLMTGPVTGTIAMPGMGTGLQSDNPVIVSAFHAALARQGLVVLAIGALVFLAWNITRSMQLRRQPGVRASAVANSEPVARRLLRVSFGLLWILDGILQAQAAMPLGMTTQVIRPAAAASPDWVQHLLNAAATTWSFHPISAPAAAVWIQIGLGVWLLAAPRGDWSRLAGLASVAWGLIVWVFGEAFGGIFAPGLTLLFGAPGAALFYCLAGALVALPERSWSTPALGRSLLRAMGLFFVGMAVLQAWPNRGFWQGQALHVANPGTLTAMVQSMAQTPQPNWLASWVSAFASFDAAHGWGVNLFVVIVIAGLGLAFLSARRQVVLVAVIAGSVVCLGDWLLIEDLGFLGGVGTDPNSMIPMSLVLIAGYLAMTRLPVPAKVPEPTEADGDEIAGAVVRPRWRDRIALNPTHAFRSVAALGAIAITLVGAAPMALAAINPNAAPILAQAQGDTPTRTDTPAPAFNLVDQAGKPVSLASLRGKTVALTFLDPVCVSACPLIAQGFRMADRLLGSDASKVEMVAIDVNPSYTTPNSLAAFDRQENLDHLSNWAFLTGSVAQLKKVWAAYGVTVEYAPTGAMTAHSETAYIVDPTGVSRYILSTDPGAATEATKSSFAVNLAGAIKSAQRLG